MKPCRLCGNFANNKIHRAREMMHGTRDEFDYVECGACGTIQIADIPELKMRYLGFQNLTGVDAFIESDIVYSPHVRILKRELTEIEPSFDFITLHHTFEHLPNPRETLREIFRLLKRGKCALVRIPLAALAWRKYGVNWVQLDPPRHLFLYTESSFRELAAEAGFAVEKVVYDSESFQFWGSEQYLRDIPLNDERSFSGDVKKSIFTPAQMAGFENQAAQLNEQNEGDQACFYLRKI